MDGANSVAGLRATLPPTPMITRISDKLHAGATGRHVALFLLAMALMAGYVMPATAGIIARAAGQSVLPLDLMFFFTPGQAYEMIERYGEGGRVLYARIQLTADLLYPITYSLSLALLLSWLFQRGFRPGHPIQRWNVIPAGSMIFDLLENTGIVAMLLLYPSIPGLLSRLTMICGTLKWGFFLATVGLVLVGIFRAAWNRLRRERAQTARL